MKIRIDGDHTADYGEFPYDKGEEFLQALKYHWPAIQGFGFVCTSAAEVQISELLVADLFVRDVIKKLHAAVVAASIDVDWNIWTVTQIKD